jgi:N-acetylglucosaminyl-diphospho-decaprenol L-rhamnosyltransferase
MKNTPVIVAVPNYNMGSNLQNLISQLIKQDYQKIVVLDDASTDDSKEVVSRFKDKRIVFDQSKSNKGAGATRNRILSHIKEPSIIHFIDADMDLETKNVPEIARKLFNKKNIGFIGGLVKNISGTQFYYNYGPNIRFKSLITSKLHIKISNLAEVNKEKSKKLRKRYEFLLHDRVDVHKKPERKEVFWVSEANMLIDSEVFKNLGGFDERLREHEILEFSIKTHEANLKSWFDPSFSATHKNIDVRPANRERARQKEYIKLIKISGPIKYYKSK